MNNQHSSPDIFDLLDNAYRAALDRQCGRCRRTYSQMSKVARVFPKAFTVNMEDAISDYRECAMAARKEYEDMLGGAPPAVSNRTIMEYSRRCNRDTCCFDIFVGRGPD